jgi:hypothetical protein
MLRADTGSKDAQPMLKSRTTVTHLLDDRNDADADDHHHDVLRLTTDV